MVSVPQRCRFYWLKQVPSRSGWTTALRRLAQARAEMARALVDFTNRGL